MILDFFLLHLSIHLYKLHNYLMDCNRMCEGFVLLMMDENVKIIIFLQHVSNCDGKEKMNNLATTKTCN